MLVLAVFKKAGRYGHRFSTFSGAVGAIACSPFPTECAKYPSGASEKWLASKIPLPSRSPLNSFTEALKEGNLNELPKRTEALHGLLYVAVGLN
jgi:hypothetical protein